MATLCNEGNNVWRIRFDDADGRRKSLGIGSMSKRDAQAFLLRVTDLINARREPGRPLPSELTVWLGNLDAPMHRRLVKARLVDSRTSVRPTLGGFLDEVFATF